MYIMTSIYTVYTPPLQVFNESTMIAAIKTSGNVYNHEAINELNIKGKNMTDLLTGEPFKKEDIIILQVGDAHISPRAAYCMGLCVFSDPKTSTHAGS